MYVVVFYDISDDRRRQRIADYLQSKGLTRVQKSVFIGRGGKALARDLARRLVKMLGNDDRDSVVILVVPSESIRDMLAIGKEVKVGWGSPIEVI